MKHNIITGGPPVFYRPTRLADDRLQIARREFDNILQLGIIRPSSRTWASPLHKFPKKDHEDRGPSENTAPSTPGRSLTVLCGATIFSKIDLIKAYHQISFVPGDVPTTAIVTPFELFQHLRMQFALRNSAHTF